MASAAKREHYTMKEACERIGVSRPPRHLKRLESFTSFNGAAFYGLPPNEATVTLVKGDPLEVPERMDAAGAVAVLDVVDLARVFFHQLHDDEMGLGAERTLEVGEHHHRDRRGRRPAGRRGAERHLIYGRLTAGGRLGRGGGRAACRLRR